MLAERDHERLEETSLLPTELEPAGAQPIELWRRRPARRLWWAAVVGPGMLVMLADTDAGSVVTAAQSGAEWRFAMVLPLLLLIPALYAIQEITVRLGVVTGKGHGALIREYCGPRWAAVSVTSLFVACIGALVTEFAGIAGVGSMFGIPRWASVGMAAAAVVALVLSGSYSRVERIAIAVGLLEFLFVAALFVLHVHPSSVIDGAARIPVSQPGFRMLLAANVGAVIMPWMIFYQQGAVIDKRLGRAQITLGRWDTLIGSAVTQVVMIAIVVASAWTIGRSHAGAALPTIGAVAGAMAPFLGLGAARIVFGLGMVGAAFVAALVVSVAASWGVSEVANWRHSVNDSPATAPGFYALFTAAVIASGGLVVFLGNLVSLSVDVEVMNSMLLPLVLVLLLVLEAKALPESDRMHGVWRYAVLTMACGIIALGLYTTYVVCSQVM